MADTDADQPGVMPDLNEEDRRVLSLARQLYRPGSPASIGAAGGALRDDPRREQVRL